MFSVAVGSDKIRKPLHFSLALGLCFFQLHLLNSYRRLQCFCFSLQFSVDKLACCFFKKHLLKSYLALKCLLFVAAVLGGQCEFIYLLVVFVAGHSNFFLCKQFLHFQTAFVFQFMAL